jgi:hypothetical protein
VNWAATRRFWLLLSAKAAAMALLAAAIRVVPGRAPRSVAKVRIEGLDPVLRPVQAGEELYLPAAGGILAVIGRDRVDEHVRTAAFRDRIDAGVAEERVIPFIALQRVRSADA